MPVVANQTARVAGVSDVVVKGRVYDDADPVVSRHPWLFDSTDAAAAKQAPRRSTADLGHRSMSSREPVERATAEPGEKRATTHVCEECGFVGKSRRSLKAHQRQAH